MSGRIPTVQFPTDIIRRQQHIPDHIASFTVPPRCIPLDPSHPNIITATFLPHNPRSSILLPQNPTPHPNASHAPPADRLLKKVSPFQIRDKKRPIPFQPATAPLYSLNDPEIARKPLIHQPTKPFRHSEICRKFCYFVVIRKKKNR